MGLDMRRWTWNVYLERADDDEPRVKMPEPILAVSESEALQKAAEYYEIPSHNLVVVRQDVDREG